jgi:DNA/RNA-binding domain of Phe-tRNA-synthetase-like protein
MKFEIAPEIFEKLPNMYVGVVVTHDIDNRKDYPEISQMLEHYEKLAQEKFAGVNVKERDEIIPYREAFRQLGINPNKYPCSVEALFKRLSKGKNLPNINPLVDLNNAISLKYTLPMGTHNLDNAKDNIVMRTADPEKDTFIPLGKAAEDVETPDEGEVVYAVGNEVRTRRWTWRQSDLGKITSKTQNVFFPIDGFIDVNKDQVDQAVQDLASQLEKIFKISVQTGVVDREHPVFEWK